MTRPAIIATVTRSTEWRIALAALAVFACGAIAWPIDLGRDGGSFLQHFYDLQQGEPVLPMITTYRTPLTALWFGTVLSTVGVHALEALHALGFALAAVLFFRLALPWGRTLAVVATAWLLGHTWYASLYHRIDSDGLFAWAVMLWAAHAVAIASRPGMASWACHAALVFIVVMIRPAALVLAVVGLMPLALAVVPFRQRLQQMAAFSLVLAVVVGAWSAHNAYRHGFFAVSRLTGATQPFLRVFAGDHLVVPENGPASRALADAVEQHILPRAPASGDSAAWLREGTLPRWSQLVVLSDQVWGWDARYRPLWDVAVEAIRREPATYLLGVARTMTHAFIVLTHRVEATAPLATAHIAPFDLSSTADVDWTLSTPDARYRYGAPDRAAAVARLEALNGRVNDLLAPVPSRAGVPGLARLLSLFGMLYGPMLIVVLVGAAGLPFVCLTADPRERMLVAVWALGLLYLTATFAGQIPAIVQYRLPFDPVFMLFALVAGRALVRGRRQLVRAAQTPSASSAR